MPELPDITAYLTALTVRIVGQPLEYIRIASPLLLRTAIPRITSIEGRTVRSLRRIGKRIVFVFDDDLFLVLHLMIAGRLHWRAFDPKKGRAKLGGRNNLAAFDFAHGSLVLTEAGTKRRASLHLVRGEAALEALDPGGIDVLSATPEEFRHALTQENRTLKRALTDPRILSGIVNAYSDEILHAARLSPIAQTHKLTPEEWQRLFTATRETLQTWIARFNAEVATAFPEKVTAFRPEMAVHGRFNQPCPVCGSPIQRIRFADNETNYCPTCQTAGKVLADRSLSRLLGKDWPRTLDELEALKRK
ncbi:MAG TPA: DNA-formamidopyrimidine glycosylase family protein [Acidobacteriaceae bacterium]